MRPNIPAAQPESMEAAIRLHSASWCEQEAAPQQYDPAQPYTNNTFTGEKEHTPAGNTAGIVAQDGGVDGPCVAVGLHFLSSQVNAFYAFCVCYNLQLRPYTSRGVAQLGWVRLGASSFLLIFFYLFFPLAVCMCGCKEGYLSPCRKDASNA